MGSISDFLENELLDHVCNATYTAPANIYLGLATADPTDAGTGASFNECANANGYARTAIVFSNSTGRSVVQNGVVTFPAATGAWGTVTHWAILDGNTHGAGNMLAHGAFVASKVIVDGNTPSVATTEIDVTYSAGEISNFLANELLDHVFRNAAYALPATYVALCTATIGDTDTGTTITEPSGGAYARELVAINGGASPTWDLAAAGVVDNTHAVPLTTATASWGTIVAVALCSALTVGNLLLYDNTMADQAVGSGDTANFAIGVLDLVMT